MAKLYSFIRMFKSWRKTVGKNCNNTNNLEACPRNAPMGQFGFQQIQYQLQSLSKKDQESNILQKQLKYNGQFHLSHLLLRDCCPSVIYHIAMENDHFQTGKSSIHGPFSIVSIRYPLVN